MAGTIAGGKAAAATNKARYGSNFYKQIGSEGGRKENPNKGFGSMTHEQRMTYAKQGAATRLKNRRIRDGSKG